MCAKGSRFLYVHKNQISSFNLSGLCWAKYIFFPSHTLFSWELVNEIFVAKTKHWNQFHTMFAHILDFWIHFNRKHNAKKGNPLYEMLYHYILKTNHDQLNSSSVYHYSLMSIIYSIIFHFWAKNLANQFSFTWVSNVQNDLVR